MQQETESTEREHPAMGRPPGHTDYVEDNVFTDEVIVVLQAYLVYTEKLKWGFYTSAKPSNVVNELVALSNDIKQEHKPRMINLVRRMRYSMDPRAATQFESLFAEVYRRIAKGFQDGQIVNDLAVEIEKYSSHFKFLTFTQPDIARQTKGTWDIQPSLRKFLSEVVRAVRIGIYLRPQE